MEAALRTLAVLGVVLERTWGPQAEEGPKGGQAGSSPGAVQGCDGLAGAVGMARLEGDPAWRW
eukprot:scaffold66148_cov33-Prasinocladus_malaysianus.AAC.1